MQLIGIQNSQSIRILWWLSMVFLSASLLLSWLATDVLFSIDTLLPIIVFSLITTWHHLLRPGSYKAGFLQMTLSILFMIGVIIYIFQILNTDIGLGALGLIIIGLGIGIISILWSNIQIAMIYAGRRINTIYSIAIFTISFIILILSALHPRSILGLF